MLLQALTVWSEPRENSSKCQFLVRHATWRLLCFFFLPRFVCPPAAQRGPDARCITASPCEGEASGKTDRGLRAAVGRLWLTPPRRCCSRESYTGTAPPLRGACCRRRLLPAEGARHSRRRDTHSVPHVSLYQHDKGPHCITWSWPTYHLIGAVGLQCLTHQRPAISYLVLFDMVGLFHLFIFQY